MTIRPALAATIAAALLLAGCGIDGPPIPPEPKERGGGIPISGTAEIGVSGTL